MRPGRLAGVVLAIVLSDALTKYLAVAYLTPAYVPRTVLGDWLRLTLVYNTGAAFGLHLGDWSRWIFTALTLFALGLMWRLYRAAPAGARWRVAALALVSGGAIGNLIDRLRSARGVVDFVDIGVGDWRWPTFNVADMAVSTGAVLLAIVLWHEEEARVRTEREAATAAGAADRPGSG
ncbi:MAG: signal peptidase II [Gemmatimonadota bacterium]|nr:signal peptidase II [Gemmatimonadota bacterium]